MKIPNQLICDVESAVICSSKPFFQSSFDTDHAVFFRNNRKQESVEQLSSSMLILRGPSTRRRILSSSKKVLRSPLFQEIANKKVGGDGKKVSKFLILHFSSKGHVHKLESSASQILLRRPYLSFFRRQTTKKSGVFEKSF